jgi:hypothetical protein
MVFGVWAMAMVGCLVAFVASLVIIKVLGLLDY